MVLLFCLDTATLHRHFDAAAARHTTAGMIWVCWPKRASGLQTDLNENVVRDYGSGARPGRRLVAAIDATWVRVEFVTRLRDR